MTTSAKLLIRAAVAEASLRGPARDVRDESRREAFGRLVGQHAEMVHALALRLGPPQEAEDIVQETFVKAWRGLGRFRREADLRTWLYRILINTCRDRFRRLARRGSPAAVRPAPRDPADRAAARELLARTLCVVETLPVRQREALLLRARGGLAYAEIARVMGIRIGSVKSHLVAARRTLTERLGTEPGRRGGGA